MKLDRRMLIGAMMAAPLGGCATTSRHTIEDGLHRLLSLSTQRAFDRLFAPDGFYDAQIARLDGLRLPQGNGRLQAMIAAVLQSDAFRRRAARALNGIAQDAAWRATPVLLDAVRGMGPRDALAVLNGGPTAATDLLRMRAGPAALDLLVPGVTRGLESDLAAIAGSAIASYAGIDYVELGHTVAAQAMDGMFDAIGREEAAIRRDPAACRWPIWKCRC